VSSMKMKMVSVGFIALCAFAPAASAQQGDDCRAVVRATSAVSGTGVIAKLRARESAISRWRQKATARDGAGFRIWLKAHDRTVNCNVGTTRTSCTVEGFPCKKF